MEAKSTKEKTNPIKEKTQKAIIMKELMDLPVEVLAKIFNFLPNHDVRCGVSLACKKFHEICQNESLVQVKDLCIYGDKERSFGLRDYEAMSNIIVQSKDLTSLKIKALKLDKAATNLVTMALQNCPKLIQLEIVETEEMWEGLYLDENNEFRSLLWSYYDVWNLKITISNFGKDLCNINLMLHSFEDHEDCYESNILGTALDDIVAGCPKLKTLSFGSHNIPGKFPVLCFPDLHSDGHSNICIFEESLFYLTDVCKNLEDLRIANAKIWLYNEEEVKEIFEKNLPNCNVEIKDCEFMKPCQNCGQRGGGVYHKGYMSRQGNEPYCFCLCIPIGYNRDYPFGDELKYHFSDEDVSSDDGEQDSNSEGSNDEEENNDIPDAMEVN